MFVSSISIGKEILLINTNGSEIFSGKTVDKLDSDKKFDNFDFSALYPVSTFNCKVLSSLERNLIKLFQ